MTSSPELCFKTQDHTQSLSRLLFAAMLVTKRFHLFMYCPVVFEVLELDYVAKRGLPRLVDNTLTINLIVV